VTLPVYLPPMVSALSQSPTSFDHATRQRPAQIEAPLGALATSATSRPENAPVSPVHIVQPAQKTVSPDGSLSKDGTASGSQSNEGEKEAPTLQQFLKNQPQSMTIEAVVLPVPVSQILRIVLGGASASPDAGNSARTLYEGVQGLLSDANTRDDSARTLKAA